jgi:hypothetical protein
MLATSCSINNAEVSSKQESVQRWLLRLIVAGIIGGISRLW